jgi:hypothetical protein
MSSRRAAATVLVIVASFVRVPTASAQPAVATLAGRVVDAQSAPTPGASVTVRSLSTATMWYATSDQEGRFAFPMLPPGPYGVDVSLSGFAPWRAESVTLQVGQDQQLDVRLALGGLQEAVVVTGEARPVTTVVDGVLNAGRIESLPLNGRNFLELALLVPGNAPTPVFDPTKTNSVLIASAGQMGRGGNITIDGQDNNDDVVGGPLLNLPIDAVQEFQIATNRFGANLGRSASSVINVVTRSGTNANLGSVAVFARDDSWQALPATQRQEATTRYNSVLASWTLATRGNFVNALNGSVSTFLNDTRPVATAPQLTFPSIQDGASFRLPQSTQQTRLQIAENATWLRGAHSIRLGGELQRVDSSISLGVFQQGRIELVEDFPSFDHTGDGRIDDNDLLFAVTLRSGKPSQALDLPDTDNTHIAGFVQDDWSVSSRLLLNAGLRYEIDTEVNNQSRAGELNPLVQPFVTGERQRDLNNLSPRFGFAWNAGPSGLLLRGGYGIYYDRIVLQIQTLERGLDGRALPVEVRAGNLFFLDPQTGRLPAFAPTISNPFTGFVLPGAGASGINIIDPHLQHPTVHEFHLGVEARVRGTNLRVDGIHNQGVHFLIGRTVGEVFNPVVGGPDRVVNIESSARTKYDALLLSADRQFNGGHGVRFAYTLSKAFNYANDDQIPFLNGPIDPNDLRREHGPTPNDRRQRLVASGQTVIGGVSLAALWTISSGVPMDIMMPDGQTRIPTIQRNAGGRQFNTASELNAFITQTNAAGGIDGVLLPLVPDTARFTDAFNSLDIRISKAFATGSHIRVEPMVEVFNLFNVTNILGVSNLNYSGFSNVLVRDSEQPGTPGFLRSSHFGQPVTTAGGVFGSGGPRAMQLAARLTF